MTDNNTTKAILMAILMSGNGQVHSAILNKNDNSQRVEAYAELADDILMKCGAGEFTKAPTGPTFHRAEETPPPPPVPRPATPDDVKRYEGPPPSGGPSFFQRE